MINETIKVDFSFIEIYKNDLVFLKKLKTKHVQSFSTRRNKNYFINNNII